MNRRLMLKQLTALAGLAALGGAARAQSGQAFQTLATRVPTDASGKIEVIEFFSYGCPHCHDFEPLLNAWLKGAPQDVSFTKVPVTFNRDAWLVLARLYYTLEALGQMDKDAAVFAAIHEQKVPLYKEDALFEWVAGQGMDRKQFTDTYKSFAVQSRLKRATQLAAAYRVSGVPLLAVDGRFLVSASMAGGYDAMLKTADQLIAKARSEAGRG